MFSLKSICPVTKQTLLFCSLDYLGGVQIPSYNTNLPTWNVPYFLFSSLYLFIITVIEGNFSSGSSKVGSIQQTNYVDFHLSLQDLLQVTNCKTNRRVHRRDLFSTVIVRYKSCYYNILLLVLYNSWLKYQNTYQLLYVAKN